MSKECDHIVGFYDTGNEELDTKVLVANSVLKGQFEYAYQIYVPRYFLSHQENRFWFCPNKGCGQPIDWEAIEKQLNS